MENMKPISTKMGVDELAENTPKWPNLSAQAQKFGIFEKKPLFGCP